MYAIISHSMYSMCQHVRCKYDHHHYTGCSIQNFLEILRNVFTYFTKVFGEIPHNVLNSYYVGHMIKYMSIEFELAILFTSLSHPLNIFVIHISCF